MTKPLTCAKRPCGSCPYRKDVPSGVWSEHEYDKLPNYDAPTWAQPIARFDCHQRDGHLCAGWVATHGNELLALRLLGDAVDPSVWTYKTDVPVFASGQEACDHGKKDIDTPSPQARRKVNQLMRVIRGASDGTTT